MAFPTQAIFEGEIERMPQRVRFASTLRDVIREQIARGVPSGELNYLDVVARNAVDAIVAYDRQVRQQWEALKAQNPRAREAEAEYWARLNRTGAQNVRGGGGGGGVGVGPFLIVGVILAIGAVAILWDWMRRHSNNADAQARADMNAKYVFLAEQAARVSNLTGVDLVALTHELMEREPTTAETVADVAKSATLPIAIAAGVGLILWFFGKARHA